jgi:hypothetical protein
MGRHTMIAIGIGIVWAGYGAIFWSYCLIKGYNISFTQTFFSTALPKWPPSQMSPDMIFPNGVDSTASGSATNPGTDPLSKDIGPVQPYQPPSQGPGSGGTGLGPVSV